MNPEPESFTLDAIDEATAVVAEAIFDLNNQNIAPAGGSLGFVMGLAMALGNVAAIYVSQHDRRARRDFERIVLQMVSDSFRSPVVHGTLDEEAVH